VYRLAVESGQHRVRALALEVSNAGVLLYRSSP